MQKKCQFEKCSVLFIKLKTIMETQTYMPCFVQMIKACNFGTMSCASVHKTTAQIDQAMAIHEQVLECKQTVTAVCACLIMASQLAHFPFQNV